MLVRRAPDHGCGLGSRSSGSCQMPRTCQTSLVRSVLEAECNQVAKPLAWDTIAAWRTSMIGGFTIGWRQPSLIRDPSRRHQMMGLPRDAGSGPAGLGGRVPTIQAGTAVVAVEGGGDVVLLTAGLVKPQRSEISCLIRLRPKRRNSNGCACVTQTAHDINDILLKKCSLLQSRTENVR